MAAAACILGTTLQPGAAVADEYADGTPRIAGISPRAVATTDFITDNDAASVMVTGFLPGEEVQLDIVSTPTGIEAIHDRKRARADGTVTFAIGGSPGRPISTYAGGYQAEITSTQSVNEKYLSIITLVVSSAATVVVTRRTQRSATDDQP